MSFDGRRRMGRSCRRRAAGAAGLGVGQAGLRSVQSWMRFVRGSFLPLHTFHLFTSAFAAAPRAVTGRGNGAVATNASCRLYGKPRAHMSYPEFTSNFYRYRITAL